MQKLIIDGKSKLFGEIPLHGAKNSILPILASTLLINGESIIHNCPQLSDVEASLKILQNFGCICKRENNTLTVNARFAEISEIPQELIREMRSSVIFLGAATSRFKSVSMCLPGGCELGPRPIDLHLSSLKQLGIDIIENGGCIESKAEKIIGNDVYIHIPSVGVTENLMIAAAKSEGTTTISNAAREPEIIDLANFLNNAGAKISGAGTSKIVINGVKKLHTVEHTIIPDRILCATYMSCVASCGGKCIIKGVIEEDIESILSVYKSIGCTVKIFNNSLFIESNGNLKPIKEIRTNYFPGFPTDAGPTLIATLTLAKGTSVFIENIFENRYNFITELKKFGANIITSGKTAIITGVNALSGAKVKCTDLRGGAAQMVAALSANGRTEIENIYHIDRGYETPEIYLQNIGAKIQRVEV